MSCLSARCAELPWGLYAGEELPRGARQVPERCTGHQIHTREVRVMLQCAAAVGYDLS